MGLGKPTEQPLQRPDRSRAYQLITRVVTNSGTADGTTHYVHDRSGNVIAELDASGATVREYIWLPEAEIAPTAASRAPIDRPVAVVDGVNSTPVTYYVHTDHLHRPIKMSDASKAFAWQAEYQPWGAVQSLSGALTLDLRFPGQWFQLEAGLHYNWHRHYDPSLGRYTQPDPLGFVDGPSVYGYAGASPYRFVDPRGLQFLPDPFIPPTDPTDPNCYDSCRIDYMKKCVFTGTVLGAGVCVYAFNLTPAGGACTLGGCALSMWRCNMASRVNCKKACTPQSWR